MNILHGIINEVVTSDHLSLVRVDIDTSLLSAIVIDTPESCDYLKKGHAVQVIFKETEVVIGKGADHKNISLRNKLTGTIGSIEKGDLLSKISIITNVGPVVSIITTASVEQLRLSKGDVVTGMIKTNEVMLSSITTKTESA